MPRRTPADAADEASFARFDAWVRPELDCERGELGGARLLPTFGR